MENENWQNQWAHTTLKVITNISEGRGKRYYPWDVTLQEDLQSFLTLEAQKLANAYQPHRDNPNPENHWARYLSVALAGRASWHWSNWIGVTTDRPEYEQASKANSAWNRIEHLLSRDDTAMSVQSRMAGVTGQKIPSPEDHYLRLEYLTERLTKLNQETLPKLTQCAEEQCTLPRQGNSQHCDYHTQKHLQLWGEGVRCEHTRCPDRAMRRGLCNTHYSAMYYRETTAGTWQPHQKPEGCSVKDCNSPHDSKGLCAKHYEIYRISLNPTCTAHGCDRNQYARKYCTKHYQQMRKGVL